MISDGMLAFVPKIYTEGIKQIFVFYARTVAFLESAITVLVRSDIEFISSGTDVEGSRAAVLLHPFNSEAVNCLKMICGEDHFSTCCCP